MPGRSNRFDHRKDRRLDVFGKVPPSGYDGSSGDLKDFGFDSEDVIMVHELDQWLSAFENGKIDRRELLSKILITLGGAIGIGAANNVVAEEPKTPTFPSNGLNHIALNVTDLPRSRDWYCKHLGLKILRDGTRNCFMNTGDDFLALFKSGKPGLNHFCFTWPGKTAKEAVRRLEAVGMQPRRAENRVYFKDPDGITVQVADENDWNDWR